MEKIQFSPQEPVYMLTKEINNLAKIVDLEYSLISDYQWDISSCNVSKSFKASLKKFNDKPSAQNTWANFKMHLHES